MNSLTQHPACIIAKSRSGSLILDTSDPSNLPYVLFNDGLRAEALPRTAYETMPLGYPDTPAGIQLGNFEHEFLHLFVMDELGLTGQSILRRVAEGKDIDGNIVHLHDAMREERLVIGVQLVMNQALGDSLGRGAKVHGFTFHLAKAAQLYTASRLSRFHDVDIEELAEKARMALYGLPYLSAMAPLLPPFFEPPAPPDLFCNTEACALPAAA